MATTFEDLKDVIHGCTRCKRLRRWCEEASGQKAAYRGQPYWSRPVAGFGDPNARLAIIGLAPGRHGANRTGRPFTGDAAGIWLYQALHQHQFSNQPTATGREDGLLLNDAYVTNLVRCAPPADKPTAEEIRACASFFGQELDLLPRLQGVLALGRMAFEGYLGWLRSQGIDARVPFQHGKTYRFGGEHPWLVASYHCSQRNTRSGRLTYEMWDAVFDQIRDLLPVARHGGD